MDQGFRIFPQQASTMAPHVDYLYLFLVGLSTFFTVLIFVAIVYLSLRYRRRSEAAPPETRTDYRLEFAWTVIPFLITLVIFGWSARLFIHMSTAPEDAMEINIIGKQWMWQVQHGSGAREINELHVPTGRPIKLIMSSQDVIHSFFIPNFRIKQDVIPGRFSTMWFEATRPGIYHLFCAEYCGTDHSRMVGRIVVMEPAQYEAWLGSFQPLSTAVAGGTVASSGATPGAGMGEPPAKLGEKLFVSLGCNACHTTGIGPQLDGVFGSTVTFEDGSSAKADEQYIRESIVNPNARIVRGFQPLMPSFQGQVSEEQIVQLVAYIKSLKDAQPNEGSK